MRRHVQKKRTQRPVSVEGVWLRVQNGRIQVLLEIGGRWRLINDELIDSGERTLISHITEPLGIRRRPLDPQTEVENGPESA